MTLDELNQIAARLAKSIRPNKEEVEELIALARERLTRIQRADMLYEEVMRRVDARMKMYEKSNDR
jgi:hypothetical protein